MKSQEAKNKTFVSVQNTFIVFLFVMLFISCLPESKGNPKRFKQGVFEIPAGDNYSKTIIVRKDSIQIETYFKTKSISKNGGVEEVNTKHVDTLFIKWKNNFAYTLRMKSPKTDLDKQKIFVQITKVTDTSYEFNAKVGYSNFKQKGTVFIGK